MAKIVKKRAWAFVLYPESAPVDWKDKLKQSGLRVAISPYHDKDIDPDGNPKKPHYHIILVYDGPTTYNNVKSFTDSLNQPIPQPVEQVRGYYRYFTHKDNADKYQYDEVEIETLGGFDISDYTEMTKSEALKIKRELILLIQEKDFVEYSDFLVYVEQFCSNEQFDVATSNTILFNNFLKSRRHKSKETHSIKVNPDTGEVVSE
ncbi:MAG: replication protein [Eubacterium sp.]